MKEIFETYLLDAFQALAQMIDWVFWILFMVISWLIYEGVKTIFIKWKINTKIWISIFVLVLGILLAIVYSYFWNKTGKSDMAGLLVSILWGMVAWKLGIEKVFEYVKSLWDKAVKVIKNGK